MLSGDWSSDVCSSDLSTIRQGSLPDRGLIKKGQKIKTFEDLKPHSNVRGLKYFQ